MKNKLKWWRYLVYKWWHSTLPLWVANKMPKKIVYWCAIRVGVNATTKVYENQVVAELLVMDALKRWEILYGQKQSKRKTSSSA